VVGNQVNDEKGISAYEGPIHQAQFEFEQLSRQLNGINNSWIIIIVLLVERVYMENIACGPSDPLGT